MKLMFLAFHLFVMSAMGASLTYSGALDLQGSGLGAVSTLLTSSGAGCVGWTGTEDVVGGEVCEGWSGILGPTNLSKTSTFALGELAATLTDLRIVFNPAETGASPGIVLEQLVLMVFSPLGGSPVLTAALQQPFNLESGGSGTGGSGFSFMIAALSPAELAAADAPSNRIGLAFVTSGHDGADETFFHLGADAGDQAEVPEPASFVCAIAGLAILIARRVWSI